MDIMGMNTMESLTKSQKIVDLHCHILPGIDDGSPDLEHSLSLARAAVDEGITHILATPHHLDGVFVNHADDVVKATAAFQKQLKKNSLPLQVFPGQEIHLSGELPELYADLLGTDERKGFLMIELPCDSVPMYTKRLFFELRKLGTTPVIVHPERNAAIQKEPNILYDFIANGFYAQLTASSLVGLFGEKIEKISRDFIEHGLVQIVASDAHDLEKRQFVLREALVLIRDSYGSAVLERFEQSAENLLNGTGPLLSEISEIKPKKRFFFF